MAFYRLEPFGEERADWRAALIACLIANTHRNPKKRRRPYEPKDFMPRFDAPTEPQNWQTQLQIAEIFTAALGGRDLRPK